MKIPRTEFPGGRGLLSLDALNTIMAWVAGGIAFAIMCLTIADVGGRALLNSPIPGAMPLSSAMLVLLVFLGVSHAEAKGRHIRVELLSSRLSGKARHILELLILVIGILFLGLFTWVSLLQALDALRIGEYDLGSLHIKLAPARFILAIGTGTLALQFVSEARGTLRRLFQKEDK